MYSGRCEVLTCNFLTRVACKASKLWKAMLLRYSARVDRQSLGLLFAFHVGVTTRTPNNRSLESRYVLFFAFFAFIMFVCFGQHNICAPLNSLGCLVEQQ